LSGGSLLESNARFYRRRATEEYSAAQRAVTAAARDRRIEMAKRFLDRLDQDEAQEILFDWGLAERRPVSPKQARKSPQPTFA
jgi:hypothetical protein